jgi:hypothetical protein
VQSAVESAARRKNAAVEWRQRQTAPTVTAPSRNNGIRASSTDFSGVLLIRCRPSTASVHKGNHNATDDLLDHVV